MKKLLLWLARNKIKKFIKSGIVVYQGNDRLLFKEKSGKIVNETVAQLANELMGETDKEKEALVKADIRSSDIANIIREEFKKSGKVSKDKIGGLNFNVINKVQDKVYDKQRGLIIGMAKNQTKSLIKSKRLAYLKDGRISFIEKNGTQQILTVNDFAVILIDKSDRNRMAMFGIFEDDIAEIIKNKGQ